MTNSKYCTSKIVQRTGKLWALAAGVFLAGTCAASQPPSTDGTNLRPVIGVFSQQTSTITGSSTIDPEVKAVLSAYKYMIPASYVKWIGQAGGRVLPILDNQLAGEYGWIQVE